MAYNDYEQVLEIHKGLCGKKNRFEIVMSLDRDIGIVGIWSLAQGYNALNEDNNCEAFAHAHYNAVNKYRPGRY